MKYKTRFDLDFSATITGAPTSEEVRHRIAWVLAEEEPYCYRLNPYEPHAVEHGTAAGASDWAPDGEDGHEAAFAALSGRFPEVVFEVFGAGSDPTDVWASRYVAGEEQQFAMASVMHPPWIQPPKEHPVCESCGSRGELVVYFNPQIFKATLLPDGAVRHLGLVPEGEPDHEVLCGACGAETSVPGLKING